MSYTKLPMTRLHIPFHYDDIYIGGPKTFMRNLKKYMDDQSLNYEKDYTKATGLFFPNLIFEEEVLEHFRKANSKIIQRLDGLSLDKSSKWYADQKKTEDIYLNDTTHVVFQSIFSRDLWFTYVGEKQQTQYTTIINGVHSDIFYPAEQQRTPDHINFITTGNFRKKDMLEPIILALDELVDTYSFTLHIIGNISDETSQELVKRSYVHEHGQRDLHYVAQELRKADIFLFSHVNPPCPNAVIEAVSTGLPVVSFDSGSMKELVGFNSELLSSVSEDLMQTYEQFDYKALKSCIEKSIQQFDTYKERAMEHVQDFSFQQTGSAYTDVFKNQGLDLSKPSFIQRLFGS